MVSTTLVSPGVSVTVTTQGVAASPSPTTTPLIFITTRSNKQTPDGTGIALGTVESNVLRVFTSQTDLLNAYGNPVFVTSGGEPVHGDETNEYGLLTAYMMLGLTSYIFVVRAAVDLGELISSSVEPSFPAANNTFWIDSTKVVGGILNWDGSNWNTVPFYVYTSTPGPSTFANCTSFGLILTIGSVTSGFLHVGDVVTGTDTTNTLPGNTRIVNQLSGTPGGAGRYTMTAAAAPGDLTSCTITGAAPNGSWAFDYTTANGTLKFKHGNAWYTATTANILAQLGVGPLIVQSTTPHSPDTGIFWYKTSSSGGGTNLNLAKYRSGDGTWILQPIVYSDTAPNPIVQDVIWCDTSDILNSGNRPLFIGTGSEFIALTEPGIEFKPLSVFVDAVVPTTGPTFGTYWYDNSYTDFAMYVEGGNIWHPIVTTTDSNPTNYQKVISSSPPEFPNQDAIWIDVGSSGTNIELDQFPLIKRWSDALGKWEVLAGDVSAPLFIQAEDPVVTLVPNGTYWINTGDLTTRNIVKMYNDSKDAEGNYIFQAWTVDGSGNTIVDEGNFWQPQSSGKTLEGIFDPAAGRNAFFGRQSQRQIVLNSLRQIIASNQDVLAESIYYQLIACPGYPETYNDITALNMEKGQISLAVFDVPKNVIPSGITLGREVTILDWITNVNNVPVTNDRGFIGTPDPYQANAYPGGLATNPTDGSLVYVGPAHILLQCIAYNDSVAYPWYAPAGPNRGLVSSVASVGYLNDNDLYVPIKLNRGQRDICYLNSINPIADIPRVGLVLYGQKTMAIPGIVLDRINVVRLICKMKYDFQQLMLPYLFELNNATTQRNATITAEKYLAGLTSLNALYDYAVLCNSSNNTPAVVAAHQLIVDVAIQPEISIEFIYVPILVLYPDQPLPSISSSSTAQSTARTALPA